MTSLAKQEANEASDRDETALAAACKLLEGDEDLQAVHSTKSVAMMLKAVKDNMKGGDLEGKEVESKAYAEVLCRSQSCDFASLMICIN